MPVALIRKEPIGIFIRSLMESVGFKVNPNEWWHFDYKDWEKYAIYDISFSEAAALAAKKDGR